jgi:hypothetical protein
MVALNSNTVAVYYHYSVNDAPIWLQTKSQLPKVELLPPSLVDGGSVLANDTDGENNTPRRYWFLELITERLL